MKVCRSQQNDVLSDTKVERLVWIPPEVKSFSVKDYTKDGLGLGGDIHILES